MVSKSFFTGSKYLVDDNDGRRDYLRLDGERFLASLSAAGQKVLHAPFEADEEKRAYLKALVAVNEGYFAAREYEDDATGKYLKHDEHAERRFRIETAERLSDAAADLRTLLSAHDVLVDAAVEAVERTTDGDAGERHRVRTAARSTLLACTDRAVSEGWFPVVEAYYYSLSPGELVAEDRERRKQRIEGTATSRGIGELLEKPHFDRPSERDLQRIRDLNRESPGPDARVWKRLLDEYSWYVDGKHGETIAADDAGFK
jgi:hypothetical protein